MATTISVSVTYPSPAQVPERGVFTTRKYGDERMIKLMGLSTTYFDPPTSNFQNVDLFHPNPGAGFGGVTKFQELTQTELDYLVSIQPKDGDGLRSKMSFLIGNKDTEGVPKRPMWTKGGGPWGEEWKSYKLRPNERLYFGTISFGGQKIKVKTDTSGNPILKKAFAKYQGIDKYEYIDFYVLDGMKKRDMGKYTHKTHPWYIQKGTWATLKPIPNLYVDTWHEGTVYHPVWSPEDYPCNYGNELWIATAFLE